MTRYISTISSVCIQSTSYFEAILTIWFHYLLENESNRLEDVEYTCVMDKLIV